MDYYLIRIFLYAGLLTSEINNNYLDLLRTRIIYKICHAMRDEARLPRLSDDELSERDLQLVWRSRAASFISPSSDMFIAISRTTISTA
jgi:hypothetical protein